MCDTIPGELLIGFARHDNAAHMLMEELYHDRIEHVKVVDSLEGRINGLNLHPRRTDYLAFRVRVPAGDEAYKINYLQFFYKQMMFRTIASGRFQDDVQSRSDLQLQVVPNSWLSTCSSGAPSDGLHRFTSAHREYLSLMRIDNAPAESGARVLVLDSGIDGAFTGTVVDRRSFVAQNGSADDDHRDRHGTLVAQIIEDVAPDTEIVVYKVADSNGRASEWDVLAGCVADSGARVINISLQFGLGDRQCAVCGRHSHSSRSSVFENVIASAMSSDEAPIVVAAAGNAGNAQLAFPARFGRVVAVASVDRYGKRSQFSNCGAIDETGAPHDLLFAAPGGQGAVGAAATESVATSPAGVGMNGTSFSAAYVSAMIARLSLRSSDRSELLTRLKSSALRGPAYARDTHGHGIVQL